MPKLPTFDSSEAVHSLEILASEVGKADSTLLDAALADTNDTDLVAKGATILTDRIVTDGARIYREAWDFWRKDATEAQKKRLRGFSQALLALAVHEVLNLHRLEQQLLADAQASAAARAVGDQSASSAATQALALRDQAAGALRDAAGQSAVLRAEVDAVVGTAEDAAALARGLSGLAGVLDGWLKKKDNKALAGRLRLANLDADYVEELQSTAKAVLATSAQARSRITDKAAQAKLDRQDGVNIVLLGQIIRAFESAHDLDRTIPRLVPISTRRLFNRNVPKKKGEAAKGAGVAAKAGEKKPAEKPADS